MTDQTDTGDQQGRRAPGAGDLPRRVALQAGPGWTPGTGTTN